MYKEDKEKYVILNIGEETKNIRIDKYLSNLKKDDIIYIEKELLKTDDEIRKENKDKKHEILKNMNILKEILKYDDEYIAVINKPKGLIVHKGSGTEDITLR